MKRVSQFLKCIKTSFCVDFSNAFYILICQFSPRDALSVRVPISFLHHHVCGVLLSRSQPEVFGINAPPVIAGVAYAKICRYFSFMNFIRKPMGFNEMPPSIRENSISRWMNIGSPFPASWRFPYKSPESYFWISEFWSCFGKIILHWEPPVPCASPPDNYLSRRLFAEAILA